MTLSPDFFRPFDAVYSDVTARIRAHPARAEDDRLWLEALIGGFQSERDSWMETKALEAYWDACERLRLRILHLTASAYLHVSYDLPRVIATNWPGRNPYWGEGPSEVQGTLCFFGLSSVFDESFRRAARRRDVTGAFSILARPVPLGVISIAANWVLHLRSTAWSHAYVLHKEPTLKRLREERMRQAMTAALKQVSNWKPWTGLLSPPDVGLPLALPYVGSVSLADVDHAWEGAGAAAIIGGSAASLAVQQIRRQRQVQEFIDELGRRTHEYVNRAVVDPENGSFDEPMQKS